MLLHDVDAVLLDMDGTLVDSTAAVERVWTDWAGKHGLDVDHVLSVIHGRQGHESMAELLPERPHEENLAENERMLAAETEQLDGIVAVPGAADFLTSLRGFPHALVTSANTGLATARMGAADLVVPDDAVTSEDVTASKPHPEGFLAGAELLGADPVRCIVFEDSRAGIAAGRAAGMRVVGVGRHTVGLGAQYIVDDLTGVRLVHDDDGPALRLPQR